MKKLMTVVALATVASVPAIALADTSGVEAAASGFTTQFVAVAAVIGGAMVSAGFGAIIWKWIKGMLFS